MSVRILASPEQQDISPGQAALQEVWYMHYSVSLQNGLHGITQKENKQ
jgi:hypothetical protein